nr:hypothetical protein Iba_chr11dCG12690 [Ipomoea batatas]
MAYQIEQMGVTLENTRKGKARAVDDVEITPTERARSDKGFLEDFKLISRFQEGFVDRRPEVNTSRVADQTEGSNHSSNHAGSSDQTEVIQTSSDAEVESLGNQAETTNNQPDNTPAEDAPTDANESTKSSSSNDSGDEEATNQMQVTIHEGAIDPTPLPREDEEPRRVDEENDTLCSPTQNVEVPRDDLQMVLTSRQVPTSPREDVAPRTQIDQAIDKEVNLRSSPSSDRGENMESPLSASHEDFEPRTANKERMPSPDPMPMTDTTSILSALQLIAKE